MTFKGTVNAAFSYVREVNYIIAYLVDDQQCLDISISIQMLITRQSITQIKKMRIGFTFCMSYFVVFKAIIIFRVILA